MTAKPENAGGTGSAWSDPVTVVAIALIAYMCGTMLHEAVGHGGACLITGGTPKEITTVSMDCSVDNRLVTAGGTLVNVVAGILFFALGRAIPRTRARLKYFFWIAMTVNLFTAAGYFAFSGIGGFGDWAMFIRGLGPQWIWRIGMTIFGALAYMSVARFSLLEMRPLIGSDKARRLANAIRLTKLPYFAGGLLACLAGSLNPQGWILVALSAAASTFGGASGLIWMPNLLRDERIPLGSEPDPIPIERSWAWIAAASALALVFIVWLGPGVRFRA